MPSAQRGLCVLGLGAAWQQNPFPCAPFIRRSYTCCGFLPSWGPSRQSPRLSRASLHLQPTDRRTDEWNYGCGGACTALAKLRRSGAQIWRDRGVVTLRKVGKLWPSPTLLQLWGRRRGPVRSFVRSGADGLPTRPVSSSA